LHFECVKFTASIRLTAEASGLLIPSTASTTREMTEERKVEESRMRRIARSLPPSLIPFFHDSLPLLVPELQLGNVLL